MGYSSPDYSNDEFRALLSALKHFTDFELDQFVHWRLRSGHGEVYVTISRSPGPGAKAQNFDLVAPDMPLRGEPGGPDELKGRLPMLEGPRAEAGLEQSEEQALVAFALAAWSDHWAGHAVDWVDQGVWSDEVAAALEVARDNMTFSQATRHRIWAHMKPRR